MQKINDFILPITLFFRERGEFLLTCPHCGEIRGIDDEGGSLESLKGEQYTDNLCNGNYEVGENARFVNDIDDLEKFDQAKYDAFDGS